MRNVAFTKIAFAEYNEWFEINTQIIARIKELLRDIDREGAFQIFAFCPYPLKGNIKL